MYTNHIFSSSAKYDCYRFRNHVFRLYPNGRITAASREDMEATAYFDFLATLTRK